MFSYSGPVFSVFLLLAFGLPQEVSSRAAPRERRLRSVANASSFFSEIQEALGSAMGCGGGVDQERLDAIERSLLPLWRSLPRNSHGRIEGDVLRHVIHRYFAKKSSLLIRGFEEARPTGKLTIGSADAESQGVPSYLEGVLQSKHAEAHGFDLKDAVSMVATIEQLVLDSDSALLEMVYGLQGKSTAHLVSHADLHEILKIYLVHIIVGDDAETVSQLLTHQYLRPRHIPHYYQFVEWLEGQIRALAFQRQVLPRAGKKHGGNPLSREYSFSDAREIVGGITNSLASFWESDCEVIRDSLVKMDTHNTGRVPLSKFYSNGNARFAESENYLRELGALDETSSWRGPQVIIPNYVQAASNCISAGSHYLTCCMNYCGALHGEIEAAIGAPTAAPREILALVSNMTAQTTMDDDGAPQLQGALTSQLEEIAAGSAGEVPLHGRLFAQWMHYVFPRECPFPHKSGTAALKTPSQFDGDYLVTHEEKDRHKEAAEALVSEEVNKEELQWMSQWSAEEELINDSIRSPRRPWQGRRFAGTGALLVAIAGLIGIMSGGRKQLMGDSLPMTKSHLV